MEDKVRIRNQADFVGKPIREEDESNAHFQQFPQLWIQIDERARDRTANRNRIIYVKKVLINLS